MDIAELKAELETLHSASFGWALSCCRRDRGEAEDVLQTVYLKILEGKARFRGEGRRQGLAQHLKNLKSRFDFRGR